MNTKVKKTLSKFLIFTLLLSIFITTNTNSIINASTEILLEENFEDGTDSGWTVQRGTWSVVSDDGNYVYYKSGTDEGRNYKGDMSWTDYSVEGKVKVLDFNSKNRAYICGRYQDGNNYYAASLYGKDDGILEIRRKVSGSSKTLVSKEYPLSEDTWYTVKLEMVGDTLNMYVNGVLELTTTDSSISSGAVGLVPHKVEAMYDDVVAYIGEDYTPPEQVVYPTPVLTPDTTVVGASSVTVSIDYDDAPIQMYKINDGEWLDYTSPITVYSNCTIYAQGSDSDGFTSYTGTLDITNIVPNYDTPTLTPNTTDSEVSSVTVDIDYGNAPIQKYKINNSSWLYYTSPITVNYNCTIYAQGSDSDGFTSDISSLEISNIKAPEYEGIFVSPTGSDEDSGTFDNPTSFTNALVTVQPGQTIYMMDGTYSYDDQITIERDNDGSAGQYKTIEPYGSAKPILDFSSQPYGNPSSVSNPRGLQINGDYWHVKNLSVKGSADNGIYIAGNYNIIELCKTYENRDTGIQLGRYASTADDISEWPSYNLILNCTSYDNADPDNYEDADGFACKLTTGPGNVFDGCIAYNNVDDGWDLYTKTATGAIGSVTIKNSIAFNSGITTSGETASGSDGNGFKLGGSSIAVDHYVENCIAFHNKAHGFTDNSNPGTITLVNCTSFDNSALKSGKSNFDLARSSSSYNIFVNLLSFNTVIGAQASDKFIGTGTSSFFYNSKKYYLIEEEQYIYHSSSATRGTEMPAPSTDEFVSITPPDVSEDLHETLRNPDGSINLGSFLKLSSDSQFKGIGVDGKDLGADLH